MSIEALDNLVKINKLKVEPPDAREILGMIKAAKTKFNDSMLEGLSLDSRFSLAYSAAHALSLAALRYRGYRSDQRYIIFQCLEHTINLPKAKWRILDKCHQIRNLAEYEGHLEIEQQLLKALVEITKDLLLKVEELDINSL